MTAPQKCAHKGCGKLFTDPQEPCIYHPGPPEFHEGQKGWKCCKPRVLTFDEFLEIPPCTTGKHSIIDENAEAQAQADREKKAKAAQEENAPKRIPISQSTTQTSANSTGSLSAAISTPPSKPASPAPELEEDSDDPSTPVPANTTCKRRACGRSSKDSSNPREEDCIYHPGVPIFHEGSKGWSCCKRRVLEFDEFMKIAGCKTRQGHCFVGKKSNSQKQVNGANDGSGSADSNSEEKLQDVRNDFYQTATTLIVSFYLKKIDKDRASVTFRTDGSGVDLDLPTSDGKRFTSSVDTWMDIDPEKSQFKILGTKLEMTIYKKDGGVGWPILRKGDRDFGERIQIGKAGRA